MDEIDEPTVDATLVQDEIRAAKRLVDLVGVETRRVVHHFGGTLETCEP